jgi:DNA-binding response OmpR family regulator
MEEKTVILLAEDDEAIVEITRIILEDAGYSVLYPDSFDALEKVIETEQYDIVLLDGWLWGKSGQSIGKKIKSRERSIPVIVLSAQTNSKILAKEMGADDVLEKPFDIDALIKIIKRYSPSDQK